MLKAITGFLFLTLFPSLAVAQNKAIVEGVRASNQTIYIDTAASRVDISTGSYGKGGNAISGVGLFVSSNVVISTDATNNVVIYATGSIMLNGVEVSTVGIFGTINNSTVTNMSSVITVTSGDLYTCVPGSTVTLAAMTSTKARIFVSGSAGLDSNAQYSFGFLLNGKLLAPWSGTLGAVQPYVNANVNQNISFNVLVSTSAGSHQACLTGGAGGGAKAYIGGDYLGASKSVTQFGMEEAH